VSLRESRVEQFDKTSCNKFFPMALQDSDEMKLVFSSSQWQADCLSFIICMALNDSNPSNPIDPEQCVMLVSGISVMHHCRYCGVL
jgi:hypothetical protein